MPTIASLSPGGGAQGQTLTVIVTGTSLTGVTSVSFGSGITVDGFTVDSATQITVTLIISSSADLGTRDVTVATPGGVDRKASGFIVT